MKTKVSKLPMKKRMDFYLKAMNLKENKRWGSLRIARFLGLSKNTVSAWLYAKCRPDSRYNRFDLSPSPELSYVIGVVDGDATVCFEEKRNRYRVRLEACDKEFVVEFKRCLEVLSGEDVNIIKHKARTSNRRPTYETYFYSKQLFDFLSRTREKLKHYIEKYPLDYIRGFFDSEGNLRWERGHGKGYVICATNCDFNLLRYVKFLIEENLNIACSLWKNGSSKATGVTSKAGVIKFCDEVKPTRRRLKYELRES